MNSRTSQNHNLDKLWILDQKHSTYEQSQNNHWCNGLGFFSSGNRLVSFWKKQDNAIIYTWIH